MGSVQSACCVHLQLQTVGGQEVPTLFEESACVQHGQLAAHLQTCVNIQLQTGGVRKSRPFLKDQLNSQLACLQAVGVRKSRPFLKNQHGFSAASMHVCISSFRPWGQEVPTLFEESARQSVCMSSDRRRQEVPTLLEESACVQHSQLAGASSASDCEGHEV